MHALYATFIHIQQDDLSKTAIIYIVRVLLTAMPNLVMLSSLHLPITVSKLEPSCDSPSVTTTITFVAVGRPPDSGEKACCLL